MFEIITKSVINTETLCEGTKNISINTHQSPPNSTLALTEMTAWHGKWYQYGFKVVVHQLMEPEYTHTHVNQFRFYSMFKKICPNLVQTIPVLQIIYQESACLIEKKCYSTFSALKLCQIGIFTDWEERISIRTKWVQLKCICFHSTVFIFYFHLFVLSSGCW